MAPPRPALRIHPADDLIVALRHLKAGEVVPVDGTSYTIADPIPAKQKFAAHDFAVGRPRDDVWRHRRPRAAADPRGRSGQHREPETRDQRHHGQAPRRALDRARRLTLAGPDLRRLQAATWTRGHGEPLDRHPARVLREPKPLLHARGPAARAGLSQDRSL